MNDLTNQIRIRDLLIYKSPITFAMISEYLINAIQRGIHIEDLVVNPYIYESRSMDVSYLINYIKSLDNVSKIFNDLYFDYLYKIRLEELINDNLADILYNKSKDSFNIIFFNINNTFNMYLDNQYLFEDFGIYMSQTSLETIIALYNTFNDQFVSSLKGYINPNLLKYHTTLSQGSEFIRDIYNQIYEQFEPIYLPFY